MLKTISCSKSTELAKSKQIPARISKSLQFFQSTQFIKCIKFYESIIFSEMDFQNSKESIKILYSVSVKVFPLQNLNLEEMNSQAIINPKLN